MAITETVRDPENFPTKSKTISLDLQKIVPLDTEGDEIYIINSTPGTGITKLGGGTINPLFIREFKAGYSRSSGIPSAPFNISASNLNLQVSIDGSTLRTVVLATGTGLSGEDIAADLQAKINALAAVGQPEAGNLAFLNATVEFRNNKFLVVSGSMSNTYTGTGKSSVTISAGLTNSADETLGFDKPISSESLASKRAVETVLTSTYSSGTTLNVASTQDLSAGQAFTITDGTNREYFVASGTTSNTLTISGAGLANGYAADSIVQKIFERDPDGDLASPYTTVDAITRFALRSLANQIDFSV